MSQITSFGSGALPPGSAVTSLNGLTDAVTIGGTANQITVGANVGQNIPLSLPTTLIGPGTIASTGLLTAGNGLTVTTGTTTITPLNTAGMVVNSAAGVLSTAATTVHCVQLGTAGGQLTSLTNGTTGQVLTAVTGGDPTWAASTGGVTSITGTANQITASASTGAITLSTPATFIAPGSIAATTTVTATLGDITVTSGNLVLTSISTALLGTIKIGGDVVLASTISGTPGTIFLGKGAGNLTSTGVGNVVIGSGLTSLTTGANNIAIGTQAAVSVTSASRNIAIGYQALFSHQAAVQGHNIAFGISTLPQLTTGVENIAIGNASGSNYTSSESSNILINATGTAAESNVIRIGTQGSSAAQQSTCYIAGITGVSVSNLNLVTINTSTGQLGSQATSSGLVTSITGTANQIAASASTGAITLSTPSTFIAPGTIASTTSLAAGNLTTAGIVYNTVTSGILTSHQTTNHAIQIGNGTQLSDLALGTQYQVLQSGGAADPAWSAYTLPATVTTGSIFLSSSTLAVAALTIGANNTILTSNGTTASWAAPAASVTSITGTAFQITASASTGAVTLSTPSQFVAPGSSSSTTSMTCGTDFTISSGTFTMTDTSANNTRGIFYKAINSTAADGTYIRLMRARAATTTVVTGDTLSTISMNGYDGSSEITCSQISSVCSGTIGANRIASNLLFYTHPDSTSASTLRLSIPSTGGLLVASPDSGVGVTISGGGLTVTGTTTLDTGLTGALQAASGVVSAGTLSVANGGTGVAALTIHYLPIGNGTSAVTLLAPSATSGVPLISQGSSSDPAYGTAVVAGGGTGVTATTVGGILVGSSTSAFTNLPIGSNTFVLTSNGTTAAWAAASGGSSFTWSTITADQTATTNNGYICNKASALVLTLPTSSAVGDYLRVTGINTALGWKIAQAASQQIFFGTSSTTSGTGGSLQSSATRDAIELVCIAANLTWQVLSAQGNITVV